MRPVRTLAAAVAVTTHKTCRWRALVATVLIAVVSLGLIGPQAAPAQAATYSNARCGNSSGRQHLRTGAAGLR